MKIKETEDLAKDILSQYEALKVVLEEKQNDLINFVQKRKRLSQKERNEVSLEYERLARLHNEIGMLEFILFK